MGAHQRHFHNKKEKKTKRSFKEFIESFSLKQIILFCSSIIIILLIALICVSYRNTKTKNGSDIVVKVNGKTITADDLYTQLKASNGRATAIDLIDSYIIDKEYKTTNEMKKAADSTIESYKSSYGDQFEQFMGYYGVTSEEDFKKLIINQTKLNNIAEDYIKKNLTDSEKKSYYETDIVGDIKASHILIGVETTDETSDEEKEKLFEEAKKKAENLIVRLNNGEDFATLAKENSTDTGSKENGGDLGYFNKDQMVSEFEKAAYKLDLNKYTTEPVKTEYGYHIILKTGQKDKPKYEEAEDTVIEKLVNKKLQDQTIYYKALDALRKEYKMTIKDKTIKKDYDDYMDEVLKETKES